MRNTISSLLILILFLALAFIHCAKKETNDIEIIAEKFIEALNNHDAKAVANLYAEDATLWIANPNYESVTGRDAIEKELQAFFDADVSLRTRLTNTMVSKNTLIMEGITTTDSTEQVYVFIAEINSEGLIQEDRTYPIQIK